MSTTYPATPRQIEYVKDLIDGSSMDDEAKADAHAWVDGGNLTKRNASEAIERLKTKQVRHSSGRVSGPATRTDYEPESGMYRLPNGDVVRVYFGQQSGKQLAKKLVDTGVPYPKDEEGKAAEGTIHEWEYLGKAGRFVSPETPKLSLEEAKEYGRMSGTCCRCGRRLDVPESVEAGIGPVCGGKTEEYR